MRFLAGCLICCLQLAMLAGVAQAEPVGALAEREMLGLASEFPGRMAGTAQERAAAEYLAGRLRTFGYAVAVEPFAVRYRQVPAGSQTAEDFEGISHNVIADRAGRSGQMIIVGAHYDTAVARTPEQLAEGIGGPGLHGLDDNASGVGVLLELAARLADVEPEHTIRFIAFGAEEVGLQGARQLVAAMPSEARAQVRFMLNIDSLITGDRLYAHAGPSSVAADPAHAGPRDRLLELARELDLPVSTNPGLHPDYPAGTGCCSDHMAFDEAGIAVVNVEATNWRLGDLDGYQQTAVSAAFPAGDSWHRAELDRADYLAEHLPAGRFGERARQVVQLLLALLEDQAGVRR